MTRAAVSFFLKKQRRRKRPRGKREGEWSGSEREERNGSNKFEGEEEEEEAATKGILMRIGLEMDRLAKAATSSSSSTFDEFQQE